jgi:hypothetical protein
MIRSIFANGGLGELSWILQLLVCWAGVLFILSTLIVSWAMRSPRAALFAAIWSIGFGVLFAPWASLSSNNPELQVWHVQYRLMTAVWASTLVAAIASIPMIAKLNQPPFEKIRLNALPERDREV